MASEAVLFVIHVLPYIAQEDNWRCMQSPIYKTQQTNNGENFGMQLGFVNIYQLIWSFDIDFFKISISY